MAHYERTKMPQPFRPGAVVGPKTRFGAEEIAAEADWRVRGACRRVKDPELFFPKGDTGPAATQIAEAKAVCNRCPVWEACLRWALDTGQDAGVWGGMSEGERRTLKRREQRNRTEAA